MLSLQHSRAVSTFSPSHGQEYVCSASRTLQKHKRHPLAKVSPLPHPPPLRSCQQGWLHKGWDAELSAHSAAVTALEDIQGCLLCANKEFFVGHKTGGIMGLWY